MAALELAKNEPYGMVLLDINMPGMNGFEVCKKLRLLPEYKSTPSFLSQPAASFKTARKPF